MTALDLQPRRMTSPDRSRRCEACCHYNVCAIQKTAYQLTEAMKDRKPFEAEALAVICIEYAPTM